MAFKKLVLIDLDGVLNQYQGKYDKNYIPPKKEGAEAFLEFIINALNCDIKIFTTRPKELVEKYIKGVTDIKEPAYLITDDRCIKHIDSDNTIKQILYFGADQEVKKYNKLKE